MKQELLAMAGYVWRHSPSALRQTAVWLTQRNYSVGVVGLVPNADDAVLLLKHRFRLPYPWGLPGGYIENGESPGATLARELEEEMGIRAEPRPGILEHELNHPCRCISYFVLTEVIDTQVPRLESGELLDYRFCSRYSLPEGLQPTHADVLRRYWTEPSAPAQNLLVVA